MNLSNKLTVFRLLCVPVILVFLLFHKMIAGGPDAPLAARIARLVFSMLADFLFIAASISDYWDGKLARKHGWITNFGKLMDPVADKVLVIALFIALVEMGIFAAWMVAAIVFREFLITGFRMLALQQGTVLAAEGLGKIKAGWQLAAIITALSFVWFYDAACLTRLHALQTFFSPYFPNGLWWIAQAAMIVSLYYTLASGWRYVRDNWGLLMATEI